MGQVTNASYPVGNKSIISFVRNLFGSIEQDSLIRAHGFLTFLNFSDKEAWYEGVDGIAISRTEWIVSFGGKPGTLVLSRNLKVAIATVVSSSIIRVRGNCWDVFLNLNIDARYQSDDPHSTSFRLRGDQTISQNMHRLNREVFKKISRNSD